MRSSNPQIDLLRSAIAMEYRETIGARTREALSRAKARGVTLGRFGRDVLAPRNREAAMARAQDLAEVVRSLQAEGRGSVRDITEALNERGIAAPRGGKWHPTSAQRLLRRLRIAGDNHAG